MLVVIVVSLIAYFVERFVKRAGLSFYNRIFGGAFGVITGGGIVLALLTVLLMFPGSSIVHAARDSHSMSMSKQVLTLLGEKVPLDIRKAFGMGPDASAEQAQPAPESDR